MGVKQDAWTAQVVAFDTGRPANVLARDALLAQWVTFGAFLDEFLAGNPKAQAEWDSQVLALRQATITKGPRFEDGVEVRAQEKQASYLSTLSPLLRALDTLGGLAVQYAADPTVPRNVQNALGRLDFTTPPVAYSPASVIYKIGETRQREVTILAPHWWQLPNQFSGLVLRGRGEPKLEDDVDNVRTKLAVRFTPTIDDTRLVALRDECAGISGID